jgi:signal transduction histidine kinase
MGVSMGDPRAGSLRVRLAVIVAVAALAFFALAGCVIVRVVDHRLHDGARHSVARAVDLARKSTPADLTGLSRGSDGHPVVAGAGPERSLLVDPVLTHMDLSEVPPDELSVTRQQVLGNPYYIAVFRVTDTPTPYTVASAEPLAGIEGTVRNLTIGLATAAMLLAALMGATAALVADRALRPVATIRAEAAAISHGTLDRRLSADQVPKELAVLAATLNSMLDRLDRAAIAQRQFTSDASHELRSPIATVRAQLELAMDTPGSLDTRGPLMLADIDRLEGIVADLLAIARADEATKAAGSTGSAGSSRSTDEPIDLDDLVHDHVDRLVARDLTLDTRGLAPAPMVGDRRLLDGLVRNLLDNAMHHAAHAMAVQTKRYDDGTVELVVDDDGPGIPNDQRDNVLERFTRLDDARARGAGGTGLGLAVALAAARHHAGRLDITDSPLGGARVIAYLGDGPVDREQSAAGAPSDHPPMSPTSSAPPAATSTPTSSIPPTTASTSVASAPQNRRQNEAGASSRDALLRGTGRSVPDRHRIVVEVRESVPAPAVMARAIAVRSRAARVLRHMLSFLVGRSGGGPLTP